MDSKYAESVKNLCNVAYGQAGVEVDIIEPLCEGGGGDSDEGGGQASH